jgi:aryl-alcohol dehydrogenase-like predicted oxidoreductase
MEYRRLGRSGLKVSAVSLGSWLTIGNAVEEERGRRIVRRAFDAGVNLFDTADVYNRGEGELALGRAVAGLPRHRLVLASKCFFPISDDSNDRGLSRKHVVESLHGSLRRLGTDYLDLYQCHRPDPEVPLDETAGAMDDLIRQGKVLYWGVSFWPAHAIAEVVTLCRAQGLHAPIANQPPYSLLERGIEAEVLPVAARHGVGQIVFSPLAQGVLTGKYRRGAAPPAGTRAADSRINTFIQRFLTADRLQQVEGLVALAERRRTSAARLALAFCLARPEVASVIVGATSEAQLDENLGAAGMQLEPELLAELERLFPAA